MSLLRLSCLTLCLALAAPACVYTNIIEPLDADVHDTTFGAKVGRADAYAILALVAWGDRGTKAAADAGGITTVRHMDIQTFAILWFVYVNQTTIVYGD